MTLPRRRLFGAALSLTLCLLALPACATAHAQGPGPAAAAESVEVNVRGKLETGVMAIGAETTGVRVSAAGMVFELDLGDRPKLRALAENLNGKRVRVSGRLERVAGVEIRERLIIRVTSLSPG